MWDGDYIHAHENNPMLKKLGTLTKTKNKKEEEDND
jgi:hypothetical protein